MCGVFLPFVAIQIVTQPGAGRTDAGEKQERKPSEYVREHFWFTTQPIDEPDEAKHLRNLIEWVGVDRLLFSSDYPHWDFDDPRFAFKTPLTEAERAKIFNGNARALYKL